MAWSFTSGTPFLDTVTAESRICRIISYYDSTWPGEVELGPPGVSSPVVRKDSYDGQGRLSERRYERGEDILWGEQYVYDAANKLLRRTYLHTGRVDIYEYTSGRVYKVNHGAVPVDLVCETVTSPLQGTSSSPDCLSEVGDWIVEDPEDNSIRYFGGVYERTYTYSGDHMTDVQHRGSGAGFGGDREIDAYGRLESVDEVAVEYDGIGNRLTVVTAAGVLSAKYDLMSRLRELSSPEGLVVKYNYRPDGLVYERQVTCGGAGGCSPEHKYYVYDESGNLAQVFDATQSPPLLTAQYYYAGEGDVPIAADLRDGSDLTRYHFIVGRTGSIKGLLDVSTGTVVERVAYDAFGGPIYEGNGLSSRYGNVLGFQSHLWDPAVGIYLARARAYNPYTGLFLQMDPSDYADAVNLYAGFANDPVNNRDPTGEVTTGESIKDLCQSIADEGTSWTMLAGCVSLDAVWQLLGAESISRLVDNFLNGRDDITGWDYGFALLEAVQLPVVGKALTWLKSLRHTARGQRILQKIQGMLRCRGGVCKNGLCFVAGTLISTPSESLAIEQVRVGDRVQTYSGDTETSVDDSWLAAEFELRSDENTADVFTIELLRPSIWFTRNEVVQLGASVWLSLSELGVEGNAKLIRFVDRPVESGPGRVVLMTVNSLSNDVYEVGFGDGMAPLRGTGSHPLYSLDRDDWVQVRDLQIGERLQTAEGAVSVEALEKVRGLHRVFNLEVEGDHEYLVGEAGVRAHNTYWKSTKVFGHTFKTHGAGAKNTKSLIDRARPTPKNPSGTPQGQWLDNQKAADLIEKAHGPFGPKGDLRISIPEGLGQVIMPDGSIQAATRALIIQNSKTGGIRTAFPIP